MSSFRVFACLTSIIAAGLPVAGILLKQPIDQREALEVADSTDSLSREFQPAPESGWESLDPGKRPAWWRPEGSVLPPHGAKIALAFRGDYHRWTNTGFAHSVGKSCSDYWSSKDNIHSTIVAPLEAAGAQVRFYFHTYNDLACPRYDKQLVKDMKPAQFKFDESYSNMLDISYTFREVFKLVLADEWADFVLLTRFDVQYNAPITSWDLNWQSVNVPFYHRRTPGVNSDLIITVPKNSFQAFMSGLQNYSGPPGDHWPRFSHLRAHMYIEYFPGIKSVHTLDPRDNTDADSMGYTFCGIVRNCSADYDSCMSR